MRSGASSGLLILTLAGLLLAGCDSEMPGQRQQVAAPGPAKFAPETKRAKQFVPEVTKEPVDAPALLREKGCHRCHAESLQVLGPSYRAIGQAYRPRREVMAEVLAQKIISGGGGNWGVVPMVSAPHVTLEEARLMAAWILDLEPQ